MTYSPIWQIINNVPIILFKLLLLLFFKIEQYKNHDPRYPTIFNVEKKGRTHVFINSLFSVFSLSYLRFIVEMMTISDLLSYVEVIR